MFPVRSDVNQNNLLGLDKLFRLRSSSAKLLSFESIPGFVKKIRQLVCVSG